MRDIISPSLVALLTPQGVQEIFELRMAVETLAVRLQA